MNDDAGSESGATADPWVIYEGPVDGDTVPVAFRGSPWEFPEVAAAALAGVVLVLALSGLIAGIVVSLPGSNGGSVVGQDILLATEWAVALLLLPLLAGIGFLWWQIQGWSEVADGWIDEDTESSGTEELVDALGHITRARWLATWTGVLGAVVSVAVIVRMIGLVLTYSNSSSVGTAGDQFDASYISAGGEVLAALLLSAVVLYAVVQLRRMCNSRLAVDDERDGDGEEDAEDEDRL